MAKKEIFLTQNGEWAEITGGDTRGVKATGSDGIVTYVIFDGQQLIRDKKEESNV